MPKGWNTYVYRTDLEEGEKYIGFFVDDKAAKAWIKDQEGEYEISDQKPRQRNLRERVESGETSLTEAQAEIMDEVLGETSEVKPQERKKS